MRHVTNVFPPVFYEDSLLGEAFATFGARKHVIEHRLGNRLGQAPVMPRLFNQWKSRMKIFRSKVWMDMKCIRVWTKTSPCGIWMKVSSNVIQMGMGGNGVRAYIFGGEIWKEMWCNGI